MKKRFLLLAICMLIVGLASAKLKVSTLADGTFVLTLEAGGDLAKEFPEQWGTSTSDLLKPVVNATKIKIVTANGAKMTTDDMQRLCGENNSGNFQRFKKVSMLDMEDAKLVNEQDLKLFEGITSMKKVIYPKTTSFIPTTFTESAKCRIEEIIIPDNKDIDLKIDNQAFHTTSLKKITFGARNKIDIGTLCCQGCNNLTTVLFKYGSKNIVIGQQAFDRCTALANIVLPEGVTEIGNGAFLGAGIVSIRLPNSLKYIRTKAFAQCNLLKSITIPEGVEQIETAAFENNYSLSDVYVIGTKTKCAEGAFTDNNAYQYETKHKKTQTPNDQDGKVVEVQKYYTPETKEMKVRTVLHFKKEAEDNYLNEYIKVIGTDKYSTSPYGNHPELNHWVFDKEGNKLPVFHSSYFEGTQGVYAGWKNFMLTDNTLHHNVFIDETRIGDKWYTMCLPFDMTEDNLKSAYGATVEVVEFSCVEVKKDKENNKSIKFLFKKQVTNTKAHHPYMIHPGIHAGDEQGVKVYIAGINKQEEKQESLDKEKVVIKADGVEYTFIGNYDNNKKLQKYSYYYYSGKDESQYKNGFYKWVTEPGGKWTPYMACILLDKDNGANVKAGMDFNEAIDDIATGIEAIEMQMTTDNVSANHANKVINLNGQVVREGSTSIEGLPAGIYIVNGKKYIVR